MNVGQNAVNIQFFIPLSLSLENRFNKPSIEDQKLIKKFIKLGFNPMVSSDRTCPTFKNVTGYYMYKDDKSLSWLSADNIGIQFEKVYLLIYWNPSTSENEKIFLESKSSFENMIFEDEEMIIDIDPSIKPDIQIAKSSVVFDDSMEEIPDGRLIIAKVEGGEFEDVVNERIKKLKEEIESDISMQ